MVRKLTISDIAAEAGVSIPTVSKVLNGHRSVSSETRERVEEVIRERGYVSNRETNRAKTDRTGLVDLVTKYTIDGEYFQEIIRGIEEILHPADQHLALYTMHGELQQAQQWQENVSAKTTDGVLFLVLPEEYLDALKQLQRRHIPYVVIDDSAQLEAATPQVGSANWAGSYRATQYLISLGHRRIGHINGDASFLTAQARLSGFRMAMESANLSIDPQLLRPGDFDHMSGYNEATYLLSLPEPPTAIIASSDKQATGVYRACYERGIRIPDDISVMGFDDVPMAAWLSPPLTTVRQSLREMGRLAASMLLQQIAGDGLKATRVELSTSLTVRESCAPPKTHR